MMAVFRSLALAERTNPDVIRLTANTSKSAVRVAILCNDALFVLVLLFMIFSNHAPVRVRFFQTRNGRSHFKRMSRCNPAPECLGRFGFALIFAGDHSKTHIPRLFHTLFYVYPVGPQSRKTLPFGTQSAWIDLLKPTGMRARSRGIVATIPERGRYPRLCSNITPC